MFVMRGSVLSCIAMMLEGLGLGVAQMAMRFRSLQVRAQPTGSKLPIEPSDRRCAARVPEPESRELSPAATQGPSKK